MTAALRPDHRATASHGPAASRLHRTGPATFAGRLTMKRIANLSLIFALVFGAVGTGCAVDPADEPGPTDESGGDEGDGGDGGDTPARPLDAAGAYRLQSKLDLATNAPSTAGDVVNKIIEITDDPDDPTLWVLDQVLAVMPSGWLKSALQSAKPYVAGYLNDRVLDLAPDFVSVAVQLANDFGQMAKGFGVTETLEVSGAQGAYTSKVTVVGARFTIDGVESDHAFADHGEAVIVVGEPVGVTLGAGKLGVGEHQFALSYGRVLRLGLDAAIVPMLEPGATSLNELFAAKVNCPLVGKAIAAAVGVGSASTYASYCAQGLDRGASYIYGKIAALDGDALELRVSGAARALDTDSDRRIDTLNSGAWEGTLSYGGSAPAPLTGATFYGARM